MLLKYGMAVMSLGGIFIMYGATHETFSLTNFLPGLSIFGTGLYMFIKGKKDTPKQGGKEK